MRGLAGLNSANIDKLCEMLGLVLVQVKQPNLPEQKPRGRPRKRRT